MSDAADDASHASEAARPGDDLVGSACLGDTRPMTSAGRPAISSQLVIDFADPRVGVGRAIAVEDRATVLEGTIEELVGSARCPRSPRGRRTRAMRRNACRRRDRCGSRATLTGRAPREHELARDAGRRWDAVLIDAKGLTTMIRRARQPHHRGEPRRMAGDYGSLAAGRAFGLASANLRARARVRCGSSSRLTRTCMTRRSLCSHAPRRSRLEPRRFRDDPRRARSAVMSSPLRASSERSDASTPTRIVLMVTSSLP